MTTPSVLTHLLRKDLRHVRFLFSVWLLLLLVQSALIGSGLGAAPDNFVAQAAFSMVMLILPLLQGLVVIVLVPLLIQDEPLVGTTAFWFTRPISRGQLLSAKALFIAAFLVIPPLVLEAVIFIANGISREDTLRALPEVLYGSLNAILPLAALAVLTRTFAKFVLWLAVAFVAMITFTIGMQIWGMIANPDAFLKNSQNATLLTSRTIVAGLLTIAGGFTVVIHQYFTRRTRRSVIILIVTVVASLTTQSLWTLDFLKQPESPVSAEVFPPGSVQIALQKHRTSDAFQLAPGRDPKTDIMATLDLEDVPAGAQLFPLHIEAELLFPDDPAPLKSDRPTQFSSRSNPWWPSVLSHAIDGIPVLNSTNEEGEVYERIFQLSTEVYRERKKAPALLEAEIEFQAKRLAVMGWLPLETGARITHGSQSFEVASVLKRTQGCQIILRERLVNLWTSKIYGPTADETRPVFLLVNRQRNEAVLPDRDNNSSLGFQMVLNAGQRLINSPLPLEFSGTRRDKTVVVIDEEWLRDAELVVLSPVSIGTLQRSLTAADFLLDPKE